MHAVKPWKVFGLGVLILLLLITILLPEQSIKWYHHAITFLWARPLFLGAMGLVLLYILFWKVPKWQVPADLDEKDHVDLEWKARQTMTQIIGGAILLGGLFFTAQTLRVSQQTLRLSQEGQITDRFAKAVEQLGSDNLTVRLGGIYSLSRIAKDSVEKDFQTVMDVLTAFVREHAPIKERLDTASMRAEQGKDVHTRSGPPTDIQAILNVIKFRTMGNLPILDLHQTDLQEANLNGADFLRADFQGANLRAAGCVGLFRGVSFQGAHLEEADLRGASLYGSNFEGAHLDGAKLQRALFDMPDLYSDDTAIDFPSFLQGLLIRVKQDTADLKAAGLEGAVVSLKGANLKGARLEGAHLQTVVDLTQEQVNQACIDKYTKLPANLKKPLPCPDLPK
jgi:uncharacterized protein YjbI with pentapeptide repeats